jgi:anti-anti-sigma factor
VHEALVLTLATRAVLRTGTARTGAVRKGCGLRHLGFPYPRGPGIKAHVFDNERLAPEPFRCEVEPLHGKVHVIPHGEIDLASVGVLDSKLRELRDSGFDHLVLDLREVAFMDSTGLRLILSWDEEARDEGLDFELIRGTPVVQRLFDVTGMTARLRFVAPAG